MAYTFLLHLSLSSFTNPLKGVNDFAIFVRTSVQQDSSQTCLFILLSLEYGIVKYTYLLHLSLSRFTNPCFTSILPSPTSQPPNIGVNDFAIFVATSVQQETSQPCLLFLTIIVVWNSKHSLIQIRNPVSFEPLGSSLLQLVWVKKPPGVTALFIGVSFLHFAAIVIISTPNNIKRVGYERRWITLATAEVRLCQTQSLNLWLILRVTNSIIIMSVSVIWLMCVIWWMTYYTMWYFCFIECHGFIFIIYADESI